MRRTPRLQTLHWTRHYYSSTHSLYVQWRNSLVVIYYFKYFFPFVVLYGVRVLLICLPG
ncbi:hypothetical protein BDV36DRAFT_275726 [Aspergillus pseudocaelatus]|uniref:Uncharacterized protein n=1 Tax=Aspergillus pseudocaelatus TaxID=1825620 RepID=A0ABQ6W4W3_9EURO|nr:hypothetical protein BDV36DRAFT_275726 [Aspergillus pseudocaelatus]